MAAINIPDTGFWSDIADDLNANFTDIPAQTIARSVSSQSVPVHDGLEATEVVINFGDEATSDFSIVNGVVEFLRETNETVAFVEIHVRKEGALVSAFNCWLETSTDSGVSWSLVADTKRSQVIADGLDVTLIFDFSFNVNVQAGELFRVVATNTGASVLSMERPDSLTTSKGQVKGFAKKLRLIRLS